jgi:hypothetical protein
MKGYYKLNILSITCADCWAWGVFYRKNIRQFNDLERKAKPMFSDCYNKLKPIRF